MLVKNRLNKLQKNNPVVNAEKHKNILTIWSQGDQW